MLFTGAKAAEAMTRDWWATTSLAAFRQRRETTKEGAVPCPAQGQAGSNPGSAVHKLQEVPFCLEIHDPPGGFHRPHHALEPPLLKEAAKNWAELTNEHTQSAASEIDGGEVANVSCALSLPPVFTQCQCVQDGCSAVPVPDRTPHTGHPQQPPVSWPAVLGDSQVERRRGH